MPTQTARDFLNLVKTSIPGALPNNCVLSTLDQGDSTYQFTLNSYFPPQLVFGIYSANAKLVVELTNTDSSKSSTNDYPLVASTNAIAIVSIPAGTIQVNATLQSVQLAPSGGMSPSIATSF